jgi:hypothetical protein
VIVRGTTNQGAFESLVIGPDYRLMFSGGETGVATNIKRAYGCMMLSMLSEQGLDEALESVREVFDFHAEDEHLRLEPSIRVISAGFAVGSAEDEDTEGFTDSVESS